MYITSPNDNVFLMPEIEEYSCVKIARSNELVTDLENQLMKTQKLLNLAKQDKIKTIKNEVQYFVIVLNLGIIEEYLSESKISKVRKNSAIYKRFKYSQDYFRKLLNNDKIEITNVTQEGYEGYAKDITFNIDDNVFELITPILEKCNERNWDYIHEGKLTIYQCNKDNKSSWSFVCSSYDEKELAEKFNEFLNKK